MAVGGQTLGTFGYATINSTVLLLRPSASQSFPLNPDIPAPINGYGGYGVMNYAEGLQFPQWTLPVVPLDTGAANWLTAANLNAWFITRSARPVWDLTALTTFVFSENGSVGNSQGVWNGVGVKGAGFSLSVRKGQGVAMMLRFAGTNATAETSAATLPATGLAGAPLSFSRVSFPGGGALIDKGVVGITIQHDTGLTPNMELDGTLRPVEQNGGTPNCTISLELNAINTLAPLGWDASTSTQTELTDVVINILIDSTTPTALSLTLRRLRIRDPRNRTGTSGRAMRTFSYDALATVSSQPLVIA